MNSVFEFQLKSPIWELVSCKRLAWLKPLEKTAVFLLYDYEFSISCLKRIGNVTRVHDMAPVAIGWQPIVENLKNENHVSWASKDCI